MARKETEREATHTHLKRQPRPMSEEKFGEVELALRTMRELYGENLVVDFKEAIGGMDFIQAASTKSYKLCYIELGYTKDWKHRRIYAKDDVPIDDAVEIFRSVCMTRKNPGALGWKDITKEIWPKMKG